MKELKFDIKSWWSETYSIESLEKSYKPDFFFKTLEKPMWQNEYFDDGWKIIFLDKETFYESIWEKEGENKIEHMHIKPCNHGIIKMQIEKASGKFLYNEIYENDAKKYSKVISQVGTFKDRNYRELENFTEDCVLTITDIGYQEKTKWFIHSQVNKEVEKVIMENGEITLIENMKLNNGINEYNREERGKLVLKKHRFETSEEVHLKIEKFGQGLEKVSKCVIKSNGTEKGEINRIRRGEILKKTWEKSSIDLKQEESTELKGVKKGTYKYTREGNNYEIAWVMTDKYFNGKFKIFNSYSRCINYFKKSESEEYEFNEYEKENSKWGSVEKNYSDEKFNLQWIKQKPLIYEELTEDIVYKSDREVQGTINNLEVLREYIEQTKILFYFVEEMKITQFPKPRLFKEIIKSEEKFDLQAKLVLSKLKENAGLTSQVVKYQSINDTLNQLQECEEHQILAFKDLVNYGHLNTESFLKKIENY